MAQLRRQHLQPLNLRSLKKMMFVPFLPMTRSLWALTGARTR